ncbi:MAG: general secretion pathway protein GspK [Candidatus Tectomicrobia bacterium]|uniref:General secretion pathway protein GspK n=1 Tax=Tectimicrobiota bacterium TaxID=2528274 RepID=A0A937W1E7_UNCTE|nr:general secretion pathway protein GspK [Candidatus Tectomicrobia bacterium]
MRKMFWCSNARGYVLVIVMGLLAILGAMALSLGAATRADLEQTRHFQDEVVAELLAKAGIEWTIHYLNTAARQNGLLQAPWLSQDAHVWERTLGPGVFHLQHRAAQGSLQPGLQDEEALVNLNTAPAAVLAGLPGVGKELAEALVHQRQQGPWSALEDVWQRGLIPGALWHGNAEQPGLRAYVTVWGSGKININTAVPAVLGALPGLTPSLVQALVQYRAGDDQQRGTRDDRWFRTVADLAQVPGIDRSVLSRLEPVVTVTSSAFRVIVTGRARHDIRQAHAHRRLAVLERTAQATTLRHWRQVD